MASPGATLDLDMPQDTGVKKSLPPETLVPNAPSQNSEEPSNSREVPDLETILLRKKPGARDPTRMLSRNFLASPGRDTTTPAPESRITGQRPRTAPTDDSDRQNVVPIGSGTGTSSGLMRAPPSSKPTTLSPDTGLLDYGVIGPLLQNPDVQTIWINGFQSILFEQAGTLKDSGLRFPSGSALEEWAQHLAAALNCPYGSGQPFVEGQLPSGHRMHLVGPPITRKGPVITLHRNSPAKFDIRSWLQQGSLDAQMAYFLNACVVGRINLLVCGNPRSGKSALLQALALLIPRNERIVALESQPTLKLGHPNFVTLKRDPDIPTMRTATLSIEQARRMTPDRILLEDCGVLEAFEFLQCWQMGYLGSMTTMAAGSAQEALERFNHLATLQVSSASAALMHSQIQRCLQLIICVRRFKGAQHRITEICEVLPPESPQDESLPTNQRLHALFQFEQKPAPGRFVVAPLSIFLLNRLHKQGVEVAEDFFKARAER